VIEPMIINGKAHLLEKHRQAGDDILIITATNDFITTPIAERLGVPTLLATKAEFIEGVFTGKVAGTPCYQSGKVTRLNAWLNEHGKKFENSYFYSDSINDLPLLELVDAPIAVTPDDKLRAHANRLNWLIID
jgi:HAD superfamily hydrolase (TIGR01490 family)